MTRLADFSDDIVIYGAGTMAGAMLSRWLEVGLPPQKVAALRKSGTEVFEGVTGVQDGALLPTNPKVLIIGVKPQVFEGVAGDIARIAGPETLVISIMAGVTREGLGDALPDAGAIARVMPNLPVATGQGVVAWIADLDPAHQARLDALLAPLGLVYRAEDEASFNLIAALTGCGPAFVYRFAGALAGAGVRLGLNPDDADKLARATLAGAAQTMVHSDQSPHEMASAVASPGGMTQAGLDVLDEDGRLTGLIADTLRAARDRGNELAAAARKD